MSTPPIESTGSSGPNGIAPWNWIRILAVAFALLGIAGLATTLTLHTLHARTLGVLLAVGGLFQLWQCLRVGRWRKRLWHFIISVLYLGAAGIVFNQPEQASGLFATLIAGILLAIGISRLFLALGKDKANGSLLTLLSGLGSLALGALLVAKWPVSGLFAVGLFVSLDLLLQSLSLFSIARAARKAANSPTLDP